MTMQYELYQELLSEEKGFGKEIIKDMLEKK